MSRAALYRLALIVVGVAAYANSLHGPFVFDDLSAISDNAHVQRLTPVGDLMRGLFATEPETPLIGRPVVALTVAVNYALGGESVVGYHVVNIAVHLLAALMLFAIVRRTCLLPTMRDRFGPAADGLGFAVALLWLVHPVQTEVVNYITQRTESIMGLCYLTALYAAIRAHDSPQRTRWLALAVLAAALGMASKEAMVTLPAVVLLYDWAFLRHGTYRDLLRKRWAVYAGLCATWAVLAALMLHAPRAGTVGGDLGVSPWTYLLNQFDVVARYARLVVWPTGLLLDYGEPIKTITFADVALDALVVLLLIAGTLVLLVRAPRAGFAAAAALIVLSPTSTFVPIVTEVGAERRMYLALACVLALGVLAAYRHVPRIRQIGVPAAGAVAAVLIVLTVQRNAVYADPVALWQSAIAVKPTNPRAHDNLGVTYHEKQRYADAIRHYQIALGLDENSPQTHYNFGNVLVSSGRHREALAHYARALEQRPNYPRARTHLAAVLVYLGELDAAIEQYRLALRDVDEPAMVHFNLANALRDTGDLTQAMHHYEQAVAHRPDLAEAWTSLGRLHRAQGRYDEALRCYDSALKVSADHPAALAGRGMALASLGRLDEAERALRTAVLHNPDDAAALFALGQVLVKRGKPAEAVRPFEQTARIAPNFAQVHCELAHLLRDEDAQRAIEHYRTAIELDPAYGDAHNGLGITLAQLGRLDEAIEHFRAALAIDPDHPGARANLDRALRMHQPTPNPLAPLPR